MSKTAIVNNRWHPSASYKKTWIVAEWHPSTATDLFPIIYGIHLTIEIYFLSRISWLISLSFPFSLSAYIRPSRSKRKENRTIGENIQNSLRTFVLSCYLETSTIGQKHFVSVKIVPQNDVLMRTPEDVNGP